ncbi:MAG: undecaprenyldiphospho-muramoylpentapeptide beta-N-acetylglucosaminyltransferase [Desulfobacterales bacterium]|jgi:UDP-N-acetylglucosamine--N-acetylmuramyl-(pentapeptide) pyrophosphoryl-undecaprenol N-acetylglucosamine transferase
MRTSDIKKAFTGLFCATPVVSSTAGRLLIAGGGTGGHLFPGIAIAREFMARNAQNVVLFVSTGNPFERKTLSRTGFALETVSVAGIKGHGIWQKLKSLALIPLGIVQSGGIIRNFKPDLVLGVGSYAAGPVVLTAWMTGIPVVLHEQNILPGITNRALARFARRIYVSFENTAGRFDTAKVRLTGNPVRREILQPPAAEDRKDEGRPEQAPVLNILVAGGSQGAHAINMAVVAALRLIRQKERLKVVHQTGTADEDHVREAYATQGINAVVSAFFDDMDSRYRQADLIICRAGATTVAEITAVGKAALFIPFPFAADDHQRLNAEALTAQGAAEMIEEKHLTAADLAERIDRFASDRTALDCMADQARKLGRPEAARLIVDDCYTFITGNRS